MLAAELLKPTTGYRERNLSLGSLCLGSMCIGLTLGWPESSLSYVLLLHVDDLAYKLPKNDTSTIQIVMNFGSCIGALIPSCVADVYGRRFAFAVAALFNFTFWVLVVTLRGYLEIICSAALGGFATGIYVTTTALYVSEISLPQTRGAIGALAAFFAYIGGLFGSCLIFIAYVRVISMVMAVMAILFLVSIPLWMLETPYYFVRKGKTLEAKLTLRALRGATRVLDVDEEFRSIELFYSTNSHLPPKDSRCNVCAMLFSSSHGKYATVGIGLLCLSQMIGAYCMDDYSKTILKIILPNYGRLIMAALDVFSVVVCLLMIEKFGRRPILLAISIVGSSTSCLMLGVLTLTRKHGGLHLQEKKEHPSLLMPGIMLCLYYLIYSLGLTPIMPILTSQFFPSRGKTLALGFCVSFIYFCSLAIQATFELLNATQGFDVTFASFAIVGSLGIPVVFLFIPETRRRTLSQIQVELEDFTILVP